MKKGFFFLLIFISVICNAQVPDTLPYYVYPAEYFTTIVDNSTHKAYNVNLDATVTQFSGTTNNISGGGTGAHNQWIITTSGVGYGMGINNAGECGCGVAAGTQVNSMTQITTDSAGNPIDGWKQIEGGQLTDGVTGGWSAAGLTVTGKVYVWGNTLGGGRGISGAPGSATANTRPVQVPMPGGVTIVKIAMGQMLVALDVNGNVYTWAGNNGIFRFPYFLGQGTSSPVYSVPTQISLPLPAIDIAGAGVTGNYAILSNNHLWAWGPYLGLMGIGSTDGGGNAFQTPGPSTYSPQDITSTLNLPHLFRHIYTNSVASYAILTDSTLWAWGDNVVGALCNGNAPDYSTTSPVYFWGLGFGGTFNLVQNSPTQIAPGVHNFAAVFSSNSLGFDAFAETGDGRLISFGRNKGAVLANGSAECDAFAGGIGGQYPTSWLTVLPTHLINVLSPTTYGSTCPYCIPNPTATDCGNCTNLTGSVTAHLTATQYGANKIILNASSTTATLNIQFYAHTQTGGPSTAQMAFAGDPIDTVTVSATGTYNFQVKVTDNYWNTSTVSASVTVNPLNVISIPAGSRIITH